MDKAHKLIRKWGATDAAVHDSQKLDDVLDLSNTGKEVWADSAYRSVQIEAGLEEKGLQSRIHRRAARNRPLTERQKSANTTRSKVRARFEHVFGHQPSSMGQNRTHHRHRAGEVPRLIDDRATTTSRPATDRESIFGRGSSAHVRGRSAPP